LVFSIVALTLLMMSVDSTIVATVLHSLQHGLGTTINWAGWTLTAYSFGFVLMLPVSGRLSELYGRRRVFLGSVVTFTVASLLCGLADNIFLLIALRAVQAAGGAGFTPSATGIIVDHFGDERDRAVSLFGSIFPIGAMIGPVFGGLFVSHWTWRGAFLVNVPIGLAVIVLALRYIPRDPPRGKVDFGMDITGMALLGCGLLAGMLAVSSLSEGHAHVVWPLVVAVLSAVAIVALWAFFRHISSSRHPLIAPNLIWGASFGPVNLVNMIYSGTTIGAAALIPLYATNRYGIGAFDAGTLLIAQGLATVALSVSIALVLRRTGHRLPLYVGGIAIAAGLLLLALRPVCGVSPYAWLAGSAFLIGAGSGTINPATRNAGLQLAPEQSSTLAALRSLSLQIGSIAIISMTTAILAGSADPGYVQAWVYVIVALLLVAALPLVARVPEHHGSW
jgi:MFS family permease